jgi:hypothetical protein
MKQKIALKEQKKTLREQIYGKFKTIGSADEKKKNISLQQFLPVRS